MRSYALHGPLSQAESSVEAWFSSQALDLEEVLSGACDSRLHATVADVIETFETIDRSILYCALGRLGCLSGLGMLTLLIITGSG